MVNTFSSFIFENYQLDRDKGVILLNYSFDRTVRFTETVNFQDKINWDQVDQTALNNALACLHLAGGASYFKAYCPETIVVESQNLNKEQSQFWNDFYTKGLGEFFFKNEIDPAGLINFPITSPVSDEVPTVSLPERSLVPIGGGKDSIVSAEALDKAGFEYSPFCLNYPAPIKATVEILRKNPVIIRRQLDPLLFELNAKGALNGHVPITGYLSCLAVISALLYGYSYIVMSLEKSADFAQAYSGENAINHQYSKSFEFETSFNDYLKRFVCNGIEYFSLLRPFYEIRIAKLFAEVVREKPQYLQAFTSCNSNFKQNSSQQTATWCGHCPKCAFVFAILAPFMPPAQLIRLFDKNLLADENLVELYRSLLGLTSQLPFECVGSSDETRAALWLIKERSEFKDTPVIELFNREAAAKISDPDELISHLLCPSSRQHQPDLFKDLFND